MFWTNFGVTVVATLYFGWHYVADDIAGIAIALFSFYLGGLACGQKFDQARARVPSDVRDHPDARPGPSPGTRLPASEGELHRCSRQGDTPGMVKFFGKVVPCGTKGN